MTMKYADCAKISIGDKKITEIITETEFNDIQTVIEIGMCFFEGIKKASQIYTCSEIIQMLLDLLKVLYSEKEVTEALADISTLVPRQLKKSKM